MSLEKREGDVPDDAVGSNELELGVGVVEGGLAIGTGSDVSEITSVADLGRGGTVGLAVGVEVTTGRHASVGVVTELAISFKKEKRISSKRFFFMRMRIMGQ